MEKREAEVRETMTKLEKAGYRLNPKTANSSKMKSNKWDAK